MQRGQLVVENRDTSMRVLMTNERLNDADK